MKMGELLESLEENNRTKSFVFFKEEDKYLYLQTNFYKIECSNRSLEVRLSESGELFVIYEKTTNKASQKHEYNLTLYEINAVSVVLNKMVKDFKENVVNL